MMLQLLTKTIKARYSNVQKPVIHFFNEKNKNAIYTLDVTDEENRQCRFGSSKKQIERQHIKEQNQKKRADRNKAIAKFLIDHPDRTYPEVSAQFGVSESTIYCVCKEYDIRRNKMSKPVGDAEKEKDAEETMVEDAPVREVTSQDEQSLQNLPQSTAVLFACESVLYMRPTEGMLSVKADGLIQAYADLYGHVTEKRKRKRPIKGQLAFRWDTGGNIEYYMIS